MTLPAEPSGLDSHSAFLVLTCRRVQLKSAAMKKEIAESATECAKINKVPVLACVRCHRNLASCFLLSMPCFPAAIACHCPHVTSRPSTLDVLVKAAHTSSCECVNCRRARSSARMCTSAPKTSTWKRYPLSSHAPFPWGCSALRNNSALHRGRVGQAKGKKLQETLKQVLTCPPLLPSAAGVELKVYRKKLALVPCACTAFGSY